MKPALPRVSSALALRGCPNIGQGAAQRTLTPQQSQEGSHDKPPASDCRDSSAPIGCGDACATGRGNHVDGAGEHSNGSRQAKPRRTSPHGLHASSRLPPGCGLRMGESLQTLVAQAEADDVILAYVVLRLVRREIACRCSGSPLPPPLAAARSAAVVLLVVHRAVHWKGGGNFRSQHLIQCTGGRRWRGR
jgi:hypothetical protein